MLNMKEFHLFSDSPYSNLRHRRTGQSLETSNSNAFFGDGQKMIIPSDSIAKKEDYERIQQSLDEQRNSASVSRTFSSLTELIGYKASVDIDAPCSANNPQISQGFYLEDLLGKLVYHAQIPCNPKRLPHSSRIDDAIITFRAYAPHGINVVWQKHNIGNPYAKVRIDIGQRTIFVKADIETDPARIDVRFYDQSKIKNNLMDKKPLTSFDFKFCDNIIEAIADVPQRLIDPGHPNYRKPPPPPIILHRDEPVDEES